MTDFTIKSEYMVLLRRLTFAAMLILYVVIWHFFRIREPEFLRAVGNGDSVKVIRMLNSHPEFAGVTRNSRMMWPGRTPLHHAASAGRLDMVELLLANGAQVNGVPDYESPLQTAVSHKEEKIALFLIEHGATPDCRDSVSNTPLITACALGLTNTASVLIAKGAEINAANDYGWTPLISAAEKGFYGIVTNLIMQGADPVLRDKSFGRTSLHHAVKNDRTDVAAFLLDNKASIEMRDNDGNTPLHCAVAESRTNSVRFLLDRGAAVNATNYSGATPLHAVIESNWVSPYPARTAELIINRGADVNAETIEGLTPLGLAAKHRRSNGAEQVIKKNGGVISGRREQ